MTGIRFPDCDHTTSAIFIVDATAIGNFPIISQRFPSARHCSAERVHSRSGGPAALQTQSHPPTLVLLRDEAT